MRNRKISKIRGLVFFLVVGLTFLMSGCDFSLAHVADVFAHNSPAYPRGFFFSKIISQ